jgi:hypothetical protein
MLLGGSPGVIDKRVGVRGDSCYTSENVAVVERREANGSVNKVTRARLSGA